MAKAKKVVKHLTGKVDLQATLSQLRNPEEAKGPRQIGQVKRNISVRIGKVSRDEVVKRLDMAEAILTTGKVPAAAKGGAPKVKDATLAKAKGDLTKANNKLKAAEARIKELESYAKPGADPPEEPKK